MKSILQPSIHIPKSSEIILNGAVIKQVRTFGKFESRKTNVFFTSLKLFLFNSSTHTFIMIYVYYFLKTFFSSGNQLIWNERATLNVSRLGTRYSSYTCTCFNTHNTAFYYNIPPLRNVCQYFISFNHLKSCVPLRKVSSKQKPNPPSVYVIIPFSVTPHICITKTITGDETTCDVLRIPTISVMNNSHYYKFTTEYIGYSMT